MAQTEAQKLAQQRYNEKNKEKRAYLRDRSTARSFIRNKAKADDLAELQALIDERQIATAVTTIDTESTTGESNSDV